jgi:hypothetical protein
MCFCWCFACCHNHLFKPLGEVQVNNSSLLAMWKFWFKTLIPLCEDGRWDSNHLTILFVFQGSPRWRHGSQYFCIWCWTLATRATNSTLSLNEAKVVMKDYDKKFLSYIEYNNWILCVFARWVWQDLWWVQINWLTLKRCSWHKIRMCKGKLHCWLY